MKNKPTRVPFQIKLLKEHHDKIKIESEKLWLQMSSFISMLIAKYDWVEIKSNEENI